MSMPVFFRPKMPLYLPSKKPYTSPKRTVSPMTIAAGFRCTDGVVLCADTENTYDGWFKFPASKITTTSELGYKLFFAHAGDIEAAKLAIQRIGLAFKENRPSTSSGFMDMLNNAAVEVIERLGSDEWAVLTVLRTGTLSRLYSVEGSRVIPQLEYKCVGTGLAVARPLITRYWRRNMSMKEASFLAAYLIREAKDHGDKVGGATQIITIPDDKRQSWDLLSPAEINGLEDSYLEAQRLMGNLLTSYSPMFTDTPQFDLDLKALNALMRKARQKRGHLMGIRESQNVNNQSSEESQEEDDSK